MPALRRSLAGLVALGLGLGGVLVVATPAQAAALTVTKAVDDGSPGTLSYELGQLDPGAPNTITITVAGPLTGPAAGYPTIFDDVTITGPAGGATLTNAAGGSFAVSGAHLTMSGLDIVSDTPPTSGGITSGISVLDGSLSLTDVTVRDFDTNVFFWDQVGSQSLDLTDVSVGGTLAHPSDLGVAVQALDGPVTLTRVAATFTEIAGIGVGGGGGTVNVDTISASDGAGGILIGDNGGSTFVVDHVTAARTTGGVKFVAKASDMTLTDVQVTDTAGIGLLITATGGSTIGATTLRASTSDDSGIVVDATDSTVTVSDVESHDNGLVPGCGCGGGGSGIELWADNATVDLSGAQSHDNDADNGGGIYLDEITDASIVTLTDVTADDNTAALDGGGIYLLAANSGSTVTITRATVSGNTATGNGGGLSLGDIEDAGTAVTVTGSTITGNRSNASAGPPAISGGGGVQVDGVGSGASVTVTSSTISGNIAGDDGGGLQVVHVADDGSSFTLGDSTVSGNTAGDFGGGIQLLEIGDGATSTATATVVRTTFDGNNSSGYGAAIAINDPAPHTTGEPTVLIDSSTLSNNTTPAGGGGIYIGNSGTGGAVVRLLNSTVTANLAQAGGAVYIEGIQPHTTRISNSTIADNTAHSSAGIEDNNPADALEIDNSIVSGGLTDLVGGTPDDLSTPNSVAARYSLVQTPRSGVTLSGPGTVTGVSAQLGTLALNGGTTKTMLVTPSSPAFNAGDPAITGAGQVDQRGQARVYQRLDMGAVEWHPELANTGSTAPEPEPPLVALLLILSGLAMVAFSRLQAARSIG